jgi:hypothetical protein
MHIPYIHDRVVRKSTASVYMVVFVNVHNRTVDLFSPHGAGDLIKGVPYEELARVDHGEHARPRLAVPKPHGWEAAQRFASGLMEPVESA